MTGDVWTLEVGGFKIYIFYCNISAKS